MRIKCEACNVFVPVEEKACRYCANCGGSIMDHGRIPNIPAQIAMTRELHGKTTGQRLFTFFFIPIVFFVAIPRFPPQSQFFLMIATLLVTFMFARSSKQRRLKKHPDIFANDHWQP